MPLYHYVCRDCHDFTQWRPMREAREPAICPTCGNAAPRGVSAPYLATMDTSKRKARAIEERSADAPGVVPRENVPHLVERDRRAQGPRRFDRAHGRYPWTVGHWRGGEPTGAWLPDALGSHALRPVPLLARPMAAGWLREILAVAVGGMIGAVARYLVYVAAGHLLGTGFPYGTLIVNVVGSFAMGVLIETMALVWSTSTEVRLFLATGSLGACTTFSSFSLDFAVLYGRRDYGLCGLYTIASLAFSIGALFAGLHLMRRLLAPRAWL
jgi:CrcB protein